MTRDMSGLQRLESLIRGYQPVTKKTKYYTVANTDHKKCSVVYILREGARTEYLTISYI